MISAMKLHLKLLVSLSATLFGWTASHKLHLQTLGGSLTPSDWDHTTRSSTSFIESNFRKGCSASGRCIPMNGRPTSYYDDGSTHDRTHISMVPARWPSGGPRRCNTMQTGRFTLSKTLPTISAQEQADNLTFMILASWLLSLKALDAHMPNT